MSTGEVLTALPLGSWLLDHHLLVLGGCAILVCAVTDLVFSACFAPGHRGGACAPRALPPPHTPVSDNPNDDGPNTFVVDCMALEDLLGAILGAPWEKRKANRI
ncbi:hypothetical protein GGX14DRAFT_598124 [Mycena pura]|uniref:Uncharacterized protein n=1 Tax=Mycena pura TaxID=153505 RepID=A0AAD6VP70_9AGAR|nr:hypothetical protein GGX14DRAFT_598124 [Mycena pura]